MSKRQTVLYEDEAVAVLDKPPGRVVTSRHAGDRRTLTEAANRQLAPAGRRLHPCHRLDRETSGAVIFAKGKSHQRALRAQFEAQSVDKTYLALVRGRLKHRGGEIRAAVSDVHDRRRGRRPLPALTRYRLIRQARGFAVVEAKPVTGRTHQIRIHFAGLGHPLLGERQYAFGKDFKLNFRRLALHAVRLRFRSPDGNRTVEVVSALPGDMAEFLNAHGIRLDPRLET